MPDPTSPPPGPVRPVLDVVVPVHDEERDLERCLRRLHAHLTDLPWSFRITVADNGSTDGTSAVAGRMAAELTHVRVVALPEPGRGGALRAAWLASDAAVLVYTDVDLSTDLAGLLPLVAPLISGHSDLAVGTRLAPSARVVRGFEREVISRGYNLLLRGTLAPGLSDAQCGFKAIRSDVARRLLPLVEDTGWFFDTELLVLARRAGLRVHEVPVDWVDDTDSRVTFGIRGADGAGRAHVLGLVVLGVAMTLTSGSLALLHALAPGASPTAEVLLLLTATAVATLVRFLLLRGWVFRARPVPSAPSPHPAGAAPPAAVPDLESSR